MKNINIGFYEVEVNAKFEHEGRQNKTAAISFLNELSLVYGYAAEHQKERGYEVTAQGFKETSDMIYEMLNALGAYDK